EIVDRALAILMQGNAQRVVAERLLPYDVDMHEVFIRWKPARIRAVLADNFVQMGAQQAILVRSLLRDAAGDKKMPFHQMLAEIAEALGRPEIPAHTIAQSWQRVTVEAQRLHALREDFERLSQISELVRRSGAPRWADKILTMPDPNDGPSLVKQDW